MAIRNIRIMGDPILEKVCKGSKGSDSPYKGTD